MLTASDKSVAMGKTVSLGATTDGDGELTYASSNTAVAKVSASGVVTAKASKATVTASLKTLKSKAVTLASNVAVSKAQGKVTYANASTNATAKRFKVNASNGKLTIPKGTAKGTYQVVLTMRAAGNGSYLSATRTVKFKVQVK